MSHFYGVVQGSRGEATRTGGSGSGMRTTAASWQGAVQVQLYMDAETGKDFAHVYLRPWRGRGVDQTLYRGPVGAFDPAGLPQIEAEAVS